ETIAGIVRLQLGESLLRFRARLFSAKSEPDCRRRDQPDQGLDRTVAHPGRNLLLPQEQERPASDESEEPAKELIACCPNDGPGEPAGVWLEGCQAITPLIKYRALMTTTRCLLAFLLLAATTASAQTTARRTAATQAEPQASLGQAAPVAETNP